MCGFALSERKTAHERIHIVAGRFGKSLDKGAEGKAGVGRRGEQRVAAMAVATSGCFPPFKYRA